MVLAINIDALKDKEVIIIISVPLAKQLDGDEVGFLCDFELLTGFGGWIGDGKTSFFRVEILKFDPFKDFSL